MTKKNKIINNIFLILFALNLIYFSSCKKDNPLDVWAISQMHYKGKDLLAKNKESIVYKAIPLYFDYESNWIVIDFDPKVKGQFKRFYEEDGYFYMDIDNFNDERFNGEYVMTLDTIRESSTSSEIRMVMESKSVYILAYKSFFKGL